MGLLEKATAITFDTKGSAPGKAVIIQTIGAGEQERTAEMYHNPGISSGPTINDRIVKVPIGGGVKVAVASHNYRINVEVIAGETIIYSTNTAGDTVKSQIKLDNAGNIDMNSGTNGAARTNDTVSSASIDDPIFWAWLSAAAVVLAGLGVVAPTPTSLASKITGGSSSVKVGD